MYSVKPAIFLSFLFASCCFSIAAFSQIDLCKNVYVWEFTNDKGERDETTRLLSNDVEDILSQYQQCEVLQRARFARLLEHINTEKAIQSLNSATQQVKTELNTIKAGYVVFGSVSRDFQGNVALRLYFENMQTSRLKSNTVFLTGDNYYNFEKRKEMLTLFINSFINPDDALPITPSNGNKNNPSKPACDPQDMPFILEESYYGIRIEFCECYYYNNKVSCPLLVKNKTNEPINLTLFSNYGDDGSRLVIEGDVFFPSNATLMSKSSGEDIAISASIPATKNGVKGALVFNNIQTKSKILEALEVKTDLVSKSFADVPLVHGQAPGK